MDRRSRSLVVRSETKEDLIVFHAMSKDVPILAGVLTGVVIFVHAYFLYLEMFRWEASRTRKVFGTTAAFAAESRAMAANQGLYNGFISVGLLCGISLGAAGLIMTCYLLLCVVVAGIYGAMTVTRAAFFAQTIPASVALFAFWAGV